MRRDQDWRKGRSGNGRLRTEQRPPLDLCGPTASRVRQGGTSAPAWHPTRRCSALLDAPQRGSSPAAPLPFSTGQRCKSREEQQVGRMGKGRAGEKGHGAAGSDCKEKMVSAVAYCRLRAGKLSSLFLARQRHWASWEHSEGWSKQPVWGVGKGICVFCWIRPISLHAFVIPNITHDSVSISFPRISSAVAPAMGNNRTKPKSEPLFSNYLHTGDTACQIQKSETACRGSVCLSWYFICLSVTTCIPGEVRGTPSVGNTDFPWNHRTKRMPFHVNKLLFHLHACYVVFLRLHFTCLGCIRVIYWNRSPSSIIYAALQS